MAQSTIMEAVGTGRVIGENATLLERGQSGVDAFALGFIVVLGPATPVNLLRGGGRSDAGQCGSDSFAEGMWCPREDGQWVSAYRRALLSEPCRTCSSCPPMGCIFVRKEVPKGRMRGALEKLREVGPTAVKASTYHWIRLAKNGWGEMDMWRTCLSVVSRRWSPLYLRKEKQICPVVASAGRSSVWHAKLESMRQKKLASSVDRERVAETSRPR
jgi:hypothetical protein